MENILFKIDKKAFNHKSQFEFQFYFNIVHYEFLQQLMEYNIVLRKFFNIENGFPGKQFSA